MNSSVDHSEAWRLGGQSQLRLTRLTSSPSSGGRLYGRLGGTLLGDLRDGCLRPLVSVLVPTFGISERASSSLRTLATVLSSAFICLAICRFDASGFALTSLAIRSRRCSV